jgi:hypothetical protein
MSLEGTAIAGHEQRLSNGRTSLTHRYLLHWTLERELFCTHADGSTGDKEHLISSRLQQGQLIDYYVDATLINTTLTTEQIGSHFYHKPAY